MEAKLAQYRAEKAKHYKSTNGSFLQAFTNFGLFKRTHDVKTTQNQEDKDAKKEETGSNDNEEATLHSEVKENIQTQSYQQEKSRNILLVERGLKILLWLVLWGLFIELQFGAVYFILSILILVYFNTRTGPRDKNKLSAYSVFNPNFERLDGQFTSEQFEKELRYGAGSVR